MDKDFKWYDFIAFLTLTPLPMIFWKDTFSAFWISIFVFWPIYAFLRNYFVNKE